jgi:hypothetical protein
VDTQYRIKPVQKTIIYSLTRFNRIFNELHKMYIYSLNSCIRIWIYGIASAIKSRARTRTQVFEGLDALQILIEITRIF